jgi:hypothetical protein
VFELKILTGFSPETKLFTTYVEICSVLYILGLFSDEVQTSKVFIKTGVGM